MLSNSSTRLDELTKLKENEQKILHTMLEVFHANTTEGNDMIIEYLQTYPLSLIFKLSEHSKELADFMESNDELNAYWASLLQDLEYPNHQITSFDGKLTLSLFVQLKGAFLLSEFQKQLELKHASAEVFLKRACDIGMFHALARRINDQIENMKAEKPTKLDNDRVDTLMHFLLQDIKKLCNLYWSIGCIDSAFTLFNVIDFLMNMPAQKKLTDQFLKIFTDTKASWQTEFNDKNLPFAITAIEEALENLYMAKLLSELPQSKLITDQLSQGRGLLANLEKQFKSPQEVQLFVKNKLEALHIPLADSFCMNAFNHVKQSIKQFHPEYKLPAELPPLQFN